MNPRVCSEDNCERPVKARGICKHHYEVARHAHTLNRYELMYDPEDRWTCTHPAPVLSSLGECSACFRPPLGLLLARLERRAA